MKQLTMLVVVIFLCLYSIGCDSDIENNNADNISATMNDATATSPAPVDDNSYSENYDGVVLTVVLDKISYELDDVIYITPTVKNNTNETIGLYVPYMDTYSHTEILTKITNDDENYLIDVDTFGIGFDCGTDSRVIKSGQEYSQTMRFETYYCNDDRPIAIIGDYKGCTKIALLSEPNDTTSSQTVYSLDFNLTIE